MKTSKDFTKHLIITTIGTFILLLNNHCTPRPATHENGFQRAVPVWPAGRQTEMNLTVRFRATFRPPAGSEPRLRIAGSTRYRIRLNDRFVGYGPARAGHGFYRMDEWELTRYLQKGSNQLEIEVAGYNVNSYDLLDQPAFLQAEVVSGDRVLASTSVSGGGFSAILSDERVQKVPRYSFQRTFVECYAEGQKGETILQKNERSEKEAIKLEDCGPRKIIPRRVPYPDFAIRQPVRVVSHGSFKTGVKPDHYWKDRSLVNIGPKFKGYREEDLTINPSIELQEMEATARVTDSVSYAPGMDFPLNSGQFRIFDLGTNLSGFVGASLDVTRGGRFYITFDEILSDHDVDFKRLGCINAITYDLAPGTYDLESFEPYTMKYIKILAVDGQCAIREVHLREYANPDIGQAEFTCPDERLNRIFRAGIETYRQNAVDIFMDCPSRERAGWLCDSYFTSHVANDLSGNTTVERNFLENFALPDSFAFLPKGMLPMCYPADHNDSVFIPNWAMWFVIQLREYLDRSADRQLVDDLKPRVMALIDYFKPFLNEDGLLERLDSWIFVEWSAANRFVQDVNYPTNMLYAATLEAAGDLYDRPDLKQQAEAMRQTIRKQSWNGQFFVDNAVRRSIDREGEGYPEAGKTSGGKGKGTLVVTENTSEVCQYFAFFFGVANPSTYPDLWKKLVKDFGPDRSKTKAWPKVWPANAFVGNYLRLELLSRYGRQSQLLDESIGYFDYMARETGTLWENITSYASCDHGFASHVVHVMYRDILGIRKIDRQNKVVSIGFADIGLPSCEGQMPLGEGSIRVRWSRSGQTLTYRVTVPDGYRIDMIQPDNLILKSEL